MAFETFKRQRAPVSGDPTVTIQKRGTISLNTAAFIALGQPEAVELLYDRDKNLMALNKVPTDTPHAYPLRGLGKRQSTHMVSGKAFMKYYGIEIGIARRYVAQLEPDGLLVVDLTQTPTEVPGNRGKPEPETEERSLTFTA